MVSMTVELRNVEGTEAAMGWAGGHTIVVDRPEGKAGGLGLGFNGGQLLALAIGGCFCNDLRYVAEALGTKLGKISVSVVVTLEGTPLLATSAAMTVSCETLDGFDPREVIDRAGQISAVTNSLRQGVPVTIQTVGGMADREPKICPECRHVFQGNGWDGIDAHWKSKHEGLMPYAKAWPLIKTGKYSKA
ncbi:OsmC family protein [Mesorhizobium sp. B2-3-12]|uniref:OsmC family protein n=1 Tax=Mesorhizobium sp. BH1-1-4 TaxID=2876662 RepID=UPI001AED1B84